MILAEYVNLEVQADFVLGEMTAITRIALSLSCVHVVTTPYLDSQSVPS